MQDLRKRKLFCNRFPGSAFVVLLCLSAALSGSDNDNFPVLLTATVAPSPQPVNTRIDPRAAQLLEQAAVVAGNLKSYHFEHVLDRRKSDVDVVVAPYACRETYAKAGSKAEIIRIGQYSYELESETENYVVYEDQFNGTFGCYRESLPDFRQRVSRLIEASIVSEEYLEGHRVVHIRYNTSPPPRPFPTGSGAMSMPTGEVWIEEQTARVIKSMGSIHEPEIYSLYSRFDEPVMPLIETPAKSVTATPQVAP